MTPKETWMGHAGHFIMGDKCRFRLNTHVNGYVISTIGELIYGQHEKFQTLGADPKSFYETMVFRAKRSTHKCCPFAATDWSELASERYETADDAAVGHARFLKKYRSRRTT